MVSPETESAIVNLEARVDAMRRLGVSRWADIELGPPPNAGSPAEDNTEQSARLEKLQKERVERLRFAASGGPRLGVKST
jgi:hypothetical protein